MTLTAAEKAAFRRSGGSLVLPLAGAKGQRMRTYFNEYNEPVRLPADPRNLEYYLERGFTLRPVENPRERLAAVGVEDWDGVTKYDVGAEGGQAAALPAAAPVATYYTPDGTALTLPADPESMAAYTGQGLSLSRPGVSPETGPRLRVVPATRPSRPGRRRFRRTG